MEGFSIYCSTAPRSGSGSVGAEFKRITTRLVCVCVITLSWAGWQRQRNLGCERMGRVLVKLRWVFIM